MTGKWARFASGIRTFRELLAAMWNGPYWWLVPVLIFLIPLALLFVFLHAVPYVAPFVYTLV